MEAAAPFELFSPSHLWSIVITLGAAQTGSPAEGRLTDEHGQSHYVMVEPDVEGERFEQGTHVLLVRMDGARFRVIRNPTDSLVD